MDSFGSAYSFRIRFMSSAVNGFFLPAILSRDVQTQIAYRNHRPSAISHRPPERPIDRGCTSITNWKMIQIRTLNSDWLTDWLTDASKTLTLHFTFYFIFFFSFLSSVFLLYFKIQFLLPFFRRKSNLIFFLRCFAAPNLVRNKILWSLSRACAHINL